MKRAADFARYWREQLAWLICSVVALILIEYFSKGIPLDLHLVEHNILEILIVVIILMIFYLGWATYDSKQPANIIVLSIFMLPVGAIEFAHLLSFQGMPDFITPNSSHKSILFWQIAGVLCAIFIFLFTASGLKPIRKRSQQIGLLGISILITIASYWYVLSFEHTWPNTFFIGGGMTPIKIYIEYAILCIHSINLIWIVVRHQSGKSHTYRFNPKSMVTALTLLVLSELAFTLYSNVSDIMNITGHILRIIAFIYIFKAIFHENVHQPVIQLIHTEQQLRETNSHLQSVLDYALEAVIIADNEGRIDYMNERSEQFTQWDFLNARGNPLEAVFRVEGIEQLVRSLINSNTPNHSSGYRSKLTKRLGDSIEIEYSATVLRTAIGENLVLFTFRDITKQIVEEKYRNRLLATLESAQDFISIADTNRRIIYYNKAAIDMLRLPSDWTYDELYIQHHPEDVSQLLLLEGLPTANEKGTWSGETVILTRDGKQIPVSQIITAHKNEEGEVEFYSTIIRDITEWKQQEARNRLAMEVSNSIEEGIMVTDSSKNIVMVNKAFTRLTGITQEEANGKSPSILSSGWHSSEFYEAMWSSIHATGAWRGEIWNKKKDGTIYLEELSITRVLDQKGNITHYVGIFTDITVRKELEARIHHQAYHDLLTGLPNRSLLQDRLQQAILYADRNNNFLGVMYVDLDRFKRINDHLGHMIGDKLLQVVSERLSKIFRATDTIARIGGDEIVILLPDLQNREDSIRLAEKVKDEISKPYYLEGHELNMTCSIGISIYPEDARDIDNLLRYADNALYKAKNMGRNNYQFYNRSDNPITNYSLENALREALKNNEFLIHYQPIIRATDQALIGVEALIRWNHSTRGLVSPADFIPVAEETGLIIQLDRWVLKQACIQMKKWHDAGLDHLRVSINLSMLQFQQPDLVTNIQDILNQTGLPPSKLNLEITERTMMNDPDASILTMHKLSTLGVSISLDDFGIGYSSFNYLKQFPINHLKIDKSFIKDIGNKDKDLSIVHGLIKMSHTMGLIVVAEGVEDEHQFELLKQGQCDYIQGYYFSKPLNSEQLSSQYSS